MDIGSGAAESPTIEVTPTSRRSLCTNLNLAAFAAIVGLILLSGSPLWYDEVWYLKSVDPLLESGPTREWLRGLPGPAGPLYAVVHAGLKPLTGLQPRGVRLATVAMAAGCVLVLWRIVKGCTRVEAPFAIALSLMAAPMIHGVTGTAMTEIPAMLLFLLHLLLLMLSYQASAREEGPDATRAAGLAVAAGVLFGLAFSGRQQYLVVMPAAVVLGWYTPAFRVPMLLYFASGSVLPAYLVETWRGLSPPETAYVGSGLSFKHLALSFSYAGFTSLIYDAGMFWRNRKLCAAIVAAMCVLNLALGLSEQVPLMELANRYLGPTLKTVYARGANGVLFGLGVAFAAQLVERFIELTDQRDRFLQYLTIATVMTLATAVRITHGFAGRYILQALPLIVIITAANAPNTRAKAVRMAVATLIGLFSLSSYLRLTT